MKGILQDQQTVLPLEAIYLRYQNLMLWAAERFVGPNDCEDIFHEAFMKVIRAGPTIQQLPPPKMKLYVLLVVKGTAIDFLRKENRYLQADVEDDVLHSLITHESNRAVGAYGRVELLEMMRILSQEEQSLLLGKYCLGLSSKDLTELVGGTDTGTRSKIHRARKKLFDEWTKSGLRMEDFLDEQRIY